MIYTKEHPYCNLGDAQTSRKGSATLHFKSARPFLLISQKTQPNECCCADMYVAWFGGVSVLLSPWR